MSDTERFHTAFGASLPFKSRTLVKQLTRS